MPQKTDTHIRKRDRLSLREIFDRMLTAYGPQGWWPLLDCAGTNPTKTGTMKGYHPGDFTFPQTPKQRFEICVGAILTQNTAWTNVEKALMHLHQAERLTAPRLASCDHQTLATLIHSAGYFNQKAVYLRTFSEFFLSLKGMVPSRDALREVKGIGNETADSILLYAYSQPEFVVDAYTRRIFSTCRYCNVQDNYLVIKKLFEDALEKKVPLFQEYHALIVEHAKRYYNKKLYRTEDPLLSTIQ